MNLRPFALAPISDEVAAIFLLGVGLFSIVVLSACAAICSNASRGGLASPATGWTAAWRNAKFIPAHKRTLDGTKRSLAGPAHHGCGQPLHPTRLPRRSTRLSPSERLGWPRFRCRLMPAMRYGVRAPTTRIILSFRDGRERDHQSHFYILESTTHPLQGERMTHDNQLHDSRRHCPARRTRWRRLGIDRARNP
jgi:hypothetical protein